MISDWIASLGSSFYDGSVLLWIAGLQRQFHRELADGLRALTAGGGGRAAFWLIGASFVYGVVHAAGPGHGKAVITTYLLTQRERLGRGVRLAAASAATQGLVAILLVYGLVWLAGWLPRETSTAVSWSERLSFLFVMLIGAMMVWRSGRALLARWRRPMRPVAALLADPGSDDEHSPEGHGPHDHDPHGHDHGHDHGPGCGCGHAHTPSVEAIDRARDLRTTVGVVLSIGLRPCSGAVLVLVFAQVIGLAWAGVAAVAAMSAGTALAIGLLAILAVQARRWAEALAGRWGTGGGLGALEGLAAGVGCLGGVIIVTIGASLLAASFAPAHPFIGM